MLSFKMALRSISSNKMRAILTMLGIIIGVLALIVLVSIVDGATSSITGTIESLGSDMVSVIIRDDKGSPITMDTLREWTENDPMVGNAAGYANASATGKYQATGKDFSVYGVMPAYFDIYGLKLSLGRTLKQTDLDNNTRVCVLNSSAATDCVGFEDCIGEQISLNGMKYTIVGVLKKDNSLTSMLFAENIAYIPYTSLLRMADNVSPTISRFYVSAPPEGSMSLTKNAMNEKLLERFNQDSDAFTVTASDTMEETMKQIKTEASLMLGGIAAISLIVGGIGIMNIMMVSVTERTKEIGIRKAIGANRGTILRQFLMEAVVLCMMGCIIGIFLSWTILRIAGVVASSLEMSFTMNIQVCLISVGFCFLIGIIFGLSPANKAAKMKPIDALHYGG